MTVKLDGWIIMEKTSLAKLINQYIYKSRDLMRESMRLCHVAYSMKRIEILLSHIRDKNKLIIDFLFYLVQCFKTFLIKKISILYII